MIVQRTAEIHLHARLPLLARLRKNASILFTVLHIRESEAVSGHHATASLNIRIPYIRSTAKAVCCRTLYKKVRANPYTIFIQTLKRMDIQTVKQPACQPNTQPVRVLARKTAAGRQPKVQVTAEEETEASFTEHPNVPHDLPPGKAEISSHWRRNSTHPTMCPLRK